MGLPPKVLETGVTDMVRISDARMSGTAYGTVVLHVCPEAAVGGPLALVKNGDMIELDVPGRRLSLDVSNEELGEAPGGVEGAGAVDEGRVPRPLRGPRAAGRYRRRPGFPGRMPRVDRAAGVARFSSQENKGLAARTSASARLRAGGASARSRRSFSGGGS